MIEWKDITAYSRSDTEKVPSVWEAKLPSGIRIVILTSHLAYKGKWVLRCSPWFETCELVGIDISDIARAKHEALQMVHSALKPGWIALENEIL